jgi:hypothetical protein
MKAAQDILLKLIRIALWGPDHNELTCKPEWNKVIELARQQTLLGLVADAIPHLPEEFRPDAQNSGKLHATAIKIYQSHSLLNREIASLKSRLDSHDIPCVLFKGQGISLNYPNPLVRQCGDIDMYVGEKNFEKVLRLLDPESDETASDYRYLKHFNVVEGGVHIEIHRIAETLPGLRQDRLFQEWTVRHLEGKDLHVVEIGGASVNLPPHQFNALYIMNHAWHHFVNGGIGLRQLCDWTIFLHRHHADIDHATLEKDLKAFGLSRAWQILAGVAVEYLGLPTEECPLYSGRFSSKSRMMMDVIWNEGNFGFYSADKKKARPAGHFAGKLHSFRIMSCRIIRVLSISPADIARSWISYFINGMRNVFVRIK